MSTHSYNQRHTVVCDVGSSCALTSSWGLRGLRLRVLRTQHNLNMLHLRRHTQSWVCWIDVSSRVCAMPSPDVNNGRAVSRRAALCLHTSMGVRLVYSAVP